MTFQEATEDLLGEKQPSKKFVTPQQIADLTIFLSSESAASITGSIQAMDGGWSAQ